MKSTTIWGSFLHINTAHGEGEGGSSKGEQQTSIGEYLIPDYRVVKAELRPPHRVLGDRPSMDATANDPGFPRTDRRSHAHMHMYSFMHQC